MTEDELPIVAEVVEEPTLSAPDSFAPAAVVPLAAPRRPRVWPVFVAFVLAQVSAQVLGLVALFAVALLLFGGAALANNPPQVLDQTVMSTPGLLAATVSSQVVMLSVALACALCSPVPWRQRLRWLPARLSAVGLVAAVLAVLALSSAMSSLSELGLTPKSDFLSQLESWLSGLSWGGGAAALLAIGVLPGIAEELLFRGYIQTRLVERWGAAWGVLWTALLFGIMHIDPVHAGFAAVLGLFLGYLAQRTGSIWPGMVCHSVNNSMSVIGEFCGWKPESSAENWLTLAVSLLVLALALAVLLWRPRSAATPDKLPQPEADA